MVPDLKDAIVAHVRDTYAREDRVPTIRQIVHRFAELNLNNRQFYQLFPGRLPELCRRADVPIPLQRLQQVEPMNSTTTRTPHATNAAALPQPVSLTLTPAQTQRLLGIAHLEGGQTPHQILDALLDADSRLRRHHLTIPQRRRIADVLDTARRAGWTGDGDVGLVNTLTRLHNLGLTHLPYPTVQGLLELTATLRRHDWTATAFVQHATRHRDALRLYRQYQRGDISYAEFERRMRLVAPS
jgi:hypothetical protein